MSKIAKDLLIWFLPIILLVLSLFPLPAIPYYGLLLQIVVTITAAIIIYYLYKMKPNYYLLWIITFVFIILIYNPLVRISIIMDIALPLALITALVYLLNWLFVFKSRA